MVILMLKKIVKTLTINGLGELEIEVNTDSDLLNLRDVKITQDFINRIGESTNLETLYITYFADSNELDFTPLKKIKTLTTLYIDGDNEQSSHQKKFAANTLKGFDYLKELSLERIILTQSDIDDIAALPELSEVRFDFCDVENGNINALKNRENLTINGLSELEIEVNTASESLNLRDIKLTQELIDNIRKSTKLETLYITYFTDSAELDFTPLKKVKTLTTLYIDGDNEKNSHQKKLAANTLKGFDYIEKLSLERIILTQSDVDDISALSELSEIRFDFCDLGNGNINA